MEAIDHNEEDVQQNQTSIEQTATQTQEINKNQTKKRHHWAMWLIIVPLAMLLFTRTAGSITAFIFSELPYDQQENLFYCNNTSQEHEKHHRLSNLVYFFSSILHWFEYGYLFYGSYCYFYSASEWPKDFRKALGSYTKSFMLKKKTKLMLIGLYFLLFLVVSVVMPIVGMAHDKTKPHYQSLEFKCQTLPVEVAGINHSLTFISHILTTFVRVMFALATATCGAIWLEMAPDQLLPITLPKQPDRDKDWEAAVKKYYMCMVEYDAKLVIVKPIYKIFRSWFVIQWVLHLAVLISNISYLLRRFFDNTVKSNVLQTTYHGLYCTYTAQVLICTYLAALKMNSYLRRFIRKKQAECTKQDENRSMSEFAYSRNILHIEMIPQSDFIPIIPGTGINLSLRGPGFIIGTAIAVIGLIAVMSTIK